MWDEPYVDGGQDAGGVQGAAEVHVPEREVPGDGELGKGSGNGPAVERGGRFGEFLPLKSYRRRRREEEEKQQRSERIAEARSAAASASGKARGAHVPITAHNAWSPLAASA